MFTKLLTESLGHIKSFSSYWLLIFNAVGGCLILLIIVPIQETTDCLLHGMHIQEPTDRLLHGMHIQEATNVKTSTR